MGQIIEMQGSSCQLVQLPALKQDQVNLDHPDTCLSKLFLKTSSDGDSTTSLGNLFQCLMSLIVSFS